MKKIYILLFSLFLVGCSSEPTIDVSNPESTVEALQQILGNEEIPERELGDYSDGMREYYDLEKYNRVLLTEEADEIQQIGLGSVTKDEVREILELIEFPEVSTFEDMLENGADNQYNKTEHFTNYQGVGVQLMLNDAVEIMEFVGYDDPYSLTIVYDEDRFELFE